MTTERCNATGCERPAAASLELRRLCREHFVVACYERLEECKQRLRDRSGGGSLADSVRQSVQECMRETADISQNSPDLDNLERARLLDILLWAAELSERLRRSHRLPISIPVRLRSEKPGRPWQEETHTQMLSRFGASVECKHEVTAGEILEIVRLDTEDRVQVRVAWAQKKSSGRSEVGLEFVSVKNFWNLDWNVPAHAGKR